MPLASMRSLAAAREADALPSLSTVLLGKVEPGSLGVLFGALVRGGSPRLRELHIQSFYLEEEGSDWAPLEANLVDPQGDEGGVLLFSKNSWFNRNLCGVGL